MGLQYWDFTGGSIKYTTRHQCIQDNGSQQPLGVRTLYFDTIYNELRSKTFSEIFQKFKKPNGHHFKFEWCNGQKIFLVPEHIMCIWYSRSITNRFRIST